MYDLIVELAHAVWKNGFSLTALGTAVFVLLKQRKVKKKLRKYIPWLLEDESEVKAYIHNQHLIMERLGIEWQDAPTSETSSSSAHAHRTSYISSSAAISVAHVAAPKGIPSYTKLSIRRLKLMREYIKKLGRTKFQALLLSLVVNGVSAYLFLSGTLDIDEKLNMAMPIINMTVGTISTWVYILVEGGIDKAREENKQPIIIEKEPTNDITYTDSGPAE